MGKGSRHEIANYRRKYKTLRYICLFMILGQSLAEGESSVGDSESSLSHNIFFATFYMSNRRIADILNWGQVNRVLVQSESRFWLSDRYMWRCNE